MRRGLDTNVLVYAHVALLPGHSEVREFLLDQLHDAETTLVLTAGVLHEFVHVVTDERRFQPSVTMHDAIALARLYLGRSNIQYVDSDERCLLRAFDLLEQYHLGRKRIADTLFAATLLTHGVRELITCNPGDFQIFKDLLVIDPRTSLPPKPL
jgi:predicted nucleic acid-binding protein